MGTTESKDAEPVRAFRWTDSDELSRAIITATAEVADVEQDDMEPLYTVVDPDALHKLLTDTEYSRTDFDGSIRFEYHGYQVALTGDGRGYLYEGQPPRSLPEFSATCER